jgi:hypothetical protein
MDPYLEGELWQEFHQTLANEIRAQLLPKLAPKYVALLARRFVVTRASAGRTDLPPEKVIYPDVNVTAKRLREGGLAVVEPETELISVLGENQPLTRIEVRDVAERSLVTVIEILSPSNKFSVGYEEYEVRRLMLHTHTHLLEIDLIRRGQRIELSGELPQAPYYAFLSRANRRPATSVFPIKLRERLPVLPVPLLSPNPDARLDLQAAVDACFALVGYERLLNYAAPPEFALEGDDAAWARERVRAAGWPND